MKKLFHDILIILASLIVSILFLFSGIKFYIHINTKNNIYDQAEIKNNYDYIIVPGAQIKKEGPSLVLKDRLDMAAFLYQAGISSNIIVSGAYEESLNLYETEIMKDYLIKLGIPSNHILEDRAGVTTYDTMIRAYQFDNNQTAIISTQAMYASRSAYLAKQVGLKADVVTCDLAYKNQTVFAYIREFLAPTKAVYYGEVLHPLPKKSLDEVPFFKEKAA